MYFFLIKVMFILFCIFVARFQCSIISVELFEYGIETDERTDREHTGASFLKCLSWHESVLCDKECSIQIINSLKINNICSVDVDITPHICYCVYWECK